MTHHRCTAWALSISFALLISCQSEPLFSASTSYRAAFIINGELTVFSSMGLPVRLPVLTGSGVTQYSRDGRSLYASYTSAESDRSEIRKVDLRTNRVSKVLRIPGFTAVVSFAISHDESRIIVSGRYRGATAFVCGIFEVRPGKIEMPRRFFHEDGRICDVTRLWRDVSLSPDDKRAVAWEPGPAVVRLIDLDSGVVQSIGRGARVSWSPDGKWIAVLDGSSDTYHVVLLKPSEPPEKKDLGSTDGLTLAWSPDSRYLLLWGVEARCLATGFGYWGSLDIADVQSGQRAMIASSRCQVNNSTGGWVSNSVLK